MTGAGYTAFEAEVIDEHVADFRKEYDRDPDWTELHDLMLERMREEDDPTLVGAFDSILAKMAATR